MKEKARKGLFSAPGLPGQYEGYVFTGPSDTWNGHPLPFFTPEAVYDMLKDLKTIGPKLIDTTDGERFLYPIGYMAFYWEEIKQKERGMR